MAKKEKNCVGRTNESDRERWLEKTLSKIPQGKRILDAGAGTQRYKKFCGHLEYVSQDFAQYDGSGDGAGLQKGEFDYSRLDIVSDITNIPEADASFDAIMCIEVLEHLPNPIEAVRELSRLLKEDGKLIVTAPFCSLTHFAPYHFSSGFNRYWFEEHFASYGLEIEEITPNGNFFEFLAQEVKRIPSITKKYTDTKVSFWEKQYIKLMRRMLQRLSRRDNGSYEVLNYGYQVVAVKKTK